MGFVPGDVVQLKSGGPKMTVEKIGKKDESHESESVWCVWFEKVGKRQEARHDTFFPISLHSYKFFVPS